MAYGNFRYLDNYNGFLPKLTGQVVSFVRDPDEFALNEYCQFVKTPAKHGAYQQISADDFVRITSVNDDVWEDATPWDKNARNQISQRMISFRCQRRAQSAVMGYQAIEQTDGWKPNVAANKQVISLTMTAMTQRVATLLTTSTNWTNGGGGSFTANALNGGAGNLVNAGSDPALPNYNAIWKTITGALSRINLLTNGTVKLKDLRFLVGPGLAIPMSQTPEMVEYCRSSPEALKILENGLDPQYNQWGLPRSYKGAKFIVEDSPIVTSALPADGTETTVSDPFSSTASRRFIFPKDQMIVLSRVGALESSAVGGPNFSTVQIYYLNERMEVEGFNDPKNRLFETRVVVDQQEIIAAPISGLEITACQ